MRKNTIIILPIIVIALLALAYVLFGENKALNDNSDIAGKLNLQKSFVKPENKLDKVYKKNQSSKLKNTKKIRLNKNFKELQNISIDDVIEPYEQNDDNSVLNITLPFVSDTYLTFHNKRQNQDEVARLRLTRESSTVVNAEITDLNNPITPRTETLSEGGYLFLNTETANDYSIELIDFNYNAAHLKIVSKSGPIKLLLDKDSTTLPLWYSYENGQVNTMFPYYNNRPRTLVINPFSPEESEDPIIEFVPRSYGSNGRNLANQSELLNFIRRSDNPDFDNPDYLYYYHFTAQDFDNEKIWLEVTNYNLHPNLNWNNLNGFNLQVPRDIYDSENRQSINRNIFLHDQGQIYQLLIGDMTDNWFDINIIYPNGRSERIRHTYNTSSYRTNIFKLEIPNSDKEFFLGRDGLRGNYFHKIRSNEGPLALAIQKNTFHNYTNQSHVRPMVRHNTESELMIADRYKLDDITTFNGSDYKITYINEDDDFTYVEFDEADEDLTTLTYPPEVSFEPNLNNLNNSDIGDPLRLSTGSDLDLNYAGKFIFNTSIRHRLQKLRFNYTTSCSIKAESLHLARINRYGYEVGIGSVFLGNLPAGVNHDVEVEISNTNFNTLYVTEPSEVLVYLAASRRTLEENLECMMSEATSPDLRFTDAQRMFVQRVFDRNEEANFSDVYQEVCRGLDSTVGCAYDQQKMVKFHFNQFEYLHGSPFFGPTGSSRQNLIIDPTPIYSNRILPAAIL